jgi:hypothetical protein
VTEPTGFQDLATGRFPDFFLIGQPKTGTTALYEMLSQHPQIHLPDLKEPNYLAEELRRAAVPAPDQPYFLKVLPSTEQEYRRLYTGARPDQITADASTLSLWSQTAAANIAAARPDAKVVAIVREPVALLHSLHMQLLQSRVERTSSFSRAIALEAERRERCARPSTGPRWEKTLLYTDHARYVTQLQRYEAALGRDQMLIIVYDDFRADNPGTVGRVLRFLGVDDTVQLSSSRANPSVRIRSSGADHLANSLKMGRGSGWRGAQGLIKLVTPTGLRRRALRFVEQEVIAAAPDPPDPRTAANLCERLHPEVVALSEYLQRDLVALWSYV